MAKNVVAAYQAPEHAFPPMKPADPSHIFNVRCLSDEDPAAAARQGKRNEIKRVSPPGLSFEEMLQNFLRRTPREGGFVSALGNQDNIFS